MTLSGVPSLEGYTLILTACPGFNESFVKPDPITVVIEANSPRQRTTLPVSSFESQTTVTCGFLHRYSTTVPSIFVSLFVYSALLWCAKTITGNIDTTTKARMATPKTLCDLI